MINGNYISYMNYLGIMKEGNSARHVDSNQASGMHFIRGSDKKSNECQRSSQYYQTSRGGTR